MFRSSLWKNVKQNKNKNNEDRKEENRKSVV